MTRALATILLAAAAPAAALDPVLVSLTAAQLCLAQQPAADPFLEQVNAELDRRENDAAPSAVAPEPERARGGLDYLSVLSALCMVIAGILAVGYALRRIGGRTPLLAGADLGRVLGRLYLSRTATLYFVQSGGKVLVIGVTAQSISTLGQFDAEDFESEVPQNERGRFDPESFMAQLEASSRKIQAPAAERDDDDMQSLRRDIERLQDFLKEEPREPHR